MSSQHRLISSRASRAFSSLAISCVITLLSLLALSFGALQKSRAEGVNGMVVNTTMSSVNQALVISPAMLPASSASAVRLAGAPLWISRRPVDVRSQVSPTREFFGLSKVAFPLLVSDLTPAAPAGKSVLMSGRTVGIR